MKPLIPSIEVDLLSAKYIAHPLCKYPTVELSINGKTGYLFEVDRNDLEAGFVPVQDIYGKVNWRKTLPKVDVPDDIADKYKIPKVLEGVSTDPRIVKIAQDFWDAINGEGFFGNTIVFPN